MPKFDVEVPVTVFVRYRVEAKNSEDALDVQVSLSRLFYTDATGGISLATHQGAISLTGMSNDNMEYERSEVFPVDGEEA